MTKRLLHISTDLSLPLDAVTSTGIVYGGKGMGKTNFGSVFAEELTHAGGRWSVIDPMGVWWGLRHAADGKGRGVECVILGGAHGDIPIEPTGGAVVADLVVDHAVNVIIDISRKTSGEMWGISDRIKFVAAYGRQLYKRQGSLVSGQRREPICQIIDEAARFIPQTIRQGDLTAAECESIWSSIVEEGRNVGLGVMLLTQRSARLNKNVAELADMMLAFRTIGPNSLQAVVDWLGAHIDKGRMKEVIGDIRSLPRGSAFLVSPGWLGVERVIQIRMRETFDSSATPKPGERALRVRGEGAKPDLALYAERMAETIERAAAEDPKALRRRIAELEAAANKPANNRVITTTNERDREKIRMLQEQLATATKTAGAYERSMTSILRMAGDLAATAVLIQEAVHKARGEAVGAAAEVPAATVPARSEPRQAAAPAPRAMPSRPPADAGGSGDVPGGERQILTVLAQRPDGVDRDSIGALAGYGRSTRDAYIARLVGRGYAIKNGLQIQATEEGIAALGSFEELPIGRDLQNWWIQRLPGGEREILQAIADAGDWITREEIGEKSGYQRSTRDAYIARLASKLLIITASGGRVQLAEALRDPHA